MSIEPFLHTTNENTNRRVTSITTDFQNNLYVLGIYKTSTSGISINNLNGTNTSIQLPSSNNLWNSFIIKYNSDGLFQSWTIFTSKSNLIYSNKIICDPSGNILIALSYYLEYTTTTASVPIYSFSTSNELGTNVFNLPLTGSVDAFLVLRWLADGSAHSWTRLNVNGSGHDNATDIALDSNLNRYVIGRFRGASTTTFRDFSTTSSSGSLRISLPTISSFGLVIVKWLANGYAHSWSIINGTGVDYGISMVIDNNNNKYITGVYNSSSVVPLRHMSTTSSYGTSSFGLPSTSSRNTAFIVKYSSTDQVISFITLPSSNYFSIGNSICLDISQNVYLVGTYRSGNAIPVRNFSQSQGSSKFSLPATGIDDAFIIKWLANGNVTSWATIKGYIINSGGTLEDSGTSVHSYGNHIYFAGSYKGIKGTEIRSLSTSSVPSSLIVYRLPETINSESGIFIIKYNIDGTLNSFNIIDSLGNDNNRVTQVSDNNGNYYIGGFTYGSIELRSFSNSNTLSPLILMQQEFYEGSASPFLLKYNNNGELILSTQEQTTIILNNIIFNSITYPTELVLDMTIVIEILESILNTSGSQNSNLANSILEKDVVVILSDLINNNTSIYGSANFSTNEIILKSGLDGTYNLNNEIYNKNVVILLHEFLHMLGIGISDIWDSSTDTKLINSSTFMYTGINGVANYKELLTINDFSYVSLLDNFVPIENNYGSGSALAHHEEGLDINLNPNARTLNGIIYPVFPQEITTSINNLGNYLSILTLGFLEDIGFNVNYNSIYIFNNMYYYPQDKCLEPESILNIIDGNKVMLNGETQYNQTRVYGLSSSSLNYRITNIPIEYPIGIQINGNEGNLTYTKLNMNNEEEEPDIIIDGINYYSGHIDITITGDFGLASIKFINDVINNAVNLLVYSNRCNNVVQNVIEENILINTNIKIFNLSITEEKTNAIITTDLFTEEEKQSILSFNTNSKKQIRENIITQVFDNFNNLERFTTTPDNLAFDIPVISDNSSLNEVIVINPNKSTTINIDKITRNQAIFIPIGSSVQIQNLDSSYTINIGSEVFIVTTINENTFNINGELINRDESLIISNYYFHFGSIVISEVQVPPINMVLTAFNSNVSMNVLGTLIEQSFLSFDADVNAIIEVNLNDIQKVFKFQTDSADLTNVSGTDIKYFVDKRYFPTRNPANAMLDPNDIERWVATGGNGGNYDSGKLFVCHDFVRYLSKKLFNTHHGVDLFNNEQEIIDNIRYKCETTVLDKIFELLNNVDVSNSLLENSIDISGVTYYYTTDEYSSENNICRTLFRRLITINKSRFAELVNTDLPQPLPFKQNDVLSFRLVIYPSQNQHELTGVDEIIPRSYKIKYKIVETSNNTEIID